MNIYNVAVLASLVCGIYAPLPPRGDRGMSGGQVGPMIPYTHLGSKNRPDFCYDDKVRRDQYFDDSFICTDILKYPGAEIDYALSLPQNNQYRNYMNMAGMCFSEDNYLMERKEVAGSRLIECVCKSDRSIITSVNYSGQRCHIVDPQAQKIYYAKCGGVCDLAYGYLEGYFCVNRGFVERSFLVYCEANKEAFMKYSHGLDFKGHGLGGFYMMKETLPTYCGCRGYFKCL